jgi:hypothetical protein
VDRPTYVQCAQDMLVHWLQLLAAAGLTSLCEGPHPTKRHTFCIKPERNIAIPNKQRKLQLHLTEGKPCTQSCLANC